MTFIKIVMIDVHHNDEIISVDDLTPTGVEMLITECEELLSNLKDKYYEEE